MHFEINAYNQENERIIEMVKKTHDWENTEGFIADGVICPEEYKKQEIRILCILAESYGYEGCKVTRIESQICEDIMGLTNKIVKTPRNLATFLWLLQRSLDQGVKVKWDEMPWLFRINKENTTQLQNALSKVAWINVKKASKPNGTKMDEHEVYTHARRNHEILREQIQVISADLIIVCGRVVFHALHEMKLLGPDLMFGRKWQVQNTGGGQQVIEVTHPSTWRGYEKLYKRFEEIYEQIKPKIQP